MENRKDQIIDTAIKRFSHFGFQKTTMNEIADDLRITKANLYYYFPDKTGLILQVLNRLVSNIHNKETEIINKYDGNLIDTLKSILNMRAQFLRKYYVLHISENLDWLKGIDIQFKMEEYYNREVESISRLFEMAVNSGEVMLVDVAEASKSYVELVKGVSVMHTMADILSGIPNEKNVDAILKSQLRATEFIFESKIRS